MSGIGHNSEGNVAAEQLRLLIERYERLDEEAKGIADDKKDVRLEVKATGFDVKTFTTIIRRRKMDRETRMEQDALLETYEAALGLD